ncbi:histone H1-like [Scyliorhinus canicula]|uniref:histone H1-like n=1 Tax=Scyliorhinus canicula TaxID=7830 RepID=UPI0018F7BDDE|nr:histone H1-like [Scyliorhinus canicula]
MTETAAAQTAPPAAPAPGKSPRKKKAAPRSKTSYCAPKLGEQILQLVAGCSDRNGMSLFAIKKALSGSGVDVAKRGSQIRLTIKRKVEKGSLVQTKGQGASGSFKIPKKESQGKMGKVKKPTANKSLVKKTAAKKVRTKKTAAQKSPAKKSAAKKTPVKKSTVRKTSSKKAAAAKKAVKKAALKKKSPGKKVSGGKPLTKVNQWKAKPKVKAAKAKKAAPGKK